VFGLRGYGCDYCMLNEVLIVDSSSQCCPNLEGVPFEGYQCRLNGVRCDVPPFLSYRVVQCIIEMLVGFEDEG
jgi:hypothetical protein